MKKLSQEEFVQRVEQAHAKDIKVLGFYKNKREKVLVRHKCGYEWKANPEPLWNGHGCPVCSGNLKKNADTIKKEIFDLVGDEYEVLGEYVNTHTKILFKHNLCGNIFQMSPKAFIFQGQRCPHERYERSAKSNTTPFAEIKAKVEKLGKGEYEIIGGYIRSSKRAKFIHHKCGTVFYAEPRSFINQNSRCPYCYRSKGEEVIRDYFLEQGYTFKEQYKIKECKNKRPLPFDFAIFQDNELLCLIEYDGAQHFEKKFNISEQEFLKIQHNDEIKNKFCLQNQINLIRIKYIRSENPKYFKEKVITKPKEKFAKYNMTIPSQAGEETPGRCND